MKPEEHYVNRSNWLRAAVLGANDGILSTASVIIGVAAASETKAPIILAGVAALVAGALSMAAGEYVSVSSQSDIETADIKREKQSLATNPDYELTELAQIYESRGLQPSTALKVAQELTAHNALEAHARDELGINEVTKANPLQAAFASGASFVFGGILPVLVVALFSITQMVLAQYVFAILFLGILGAISAKTGGANLWKAIARIIFWGTMAMGITALIGYWFDVSIN